MEKNDGRMKIMEIPIKYYFIEEDFLDFCKRKNWIILHNTKKI